MLFSTTVFSAVATVVRVAAGFALIKLIALTGGPGGLALVGQFQNIVGLFGSVAGAPFQSGVVKFIAEYRDQPDLLTRFLGTAVRVAGVVAVVCCFLPLLMYERISAWVMPSDEYSSLFLSLAVTLPFIVLNTMSMSVLNGLGRIKTCLSLAAGATLCTLLLTIPLLTLFGLKGALYAILLSPMALSIASVMSLRPSWGLWLASCRQRIDKEALVNVSRFTLMGLTSLCVAPLVQLAIRTKIAGTLGWEAAGYWQGVWRTSETYLSVITTALSLYYLPKLSRIATTAEFRSEVRGYLRLMVPASIALSIAVFLSRDLILAVLFSSEFQPARELFAFQLAGDVLKITTWAFSYRMLAKAMTKLFIGSEIAFSALFYLFTVLLIPVLGIQAPVAAYFLMYCAYSLFIWLAIGRNTFRPSTSPS